MIKKTIGPLILILVIAAAGWRIYHSQSGSLNFDLNPYHALGAGAAEETVKLLGNKGQVVVIAQDTTDFKNPAVDGQLKSFQNTLKKNKSMSIAAPVRFKLTPMERMSTGGAAPRDLFVNALQSNPNLSAQ